MGTSGNGDPIQLGAGTAVSAMPSLFTQGSVDSTGVTTDVAINQDGFFVVQNNGVTSYTRAGNFTQDDTASWLQAKVHKSWDFRQPMVSSTQGKGSRD